MLGDDGARLAKRHGAVTMDERRALGEASADVRARLAASVGLCEPEERPSPAELLERFHGSCRLAAVGKIAGDRSVEIDAPVERCFEIAADIEHAPEWQGSLRDAEVLERDAEGRAELVETQSDAKVKTVRSTLRFSYNRPTGIRWVQEKGDTKSLEGWWTLEDLGEGRTRATYALEADPGRMLGMLLRGPVEGQVRNFLLGGAAEGLKQRAESG